MSRLRGVEKEAEDIITALKLESHHTILDFGAGSGEVVKPAMGSMKT